MKQLRASITAKLTVATLLPLCVAIVICWFTGVFILTSKIVSQAHDKVRNDLNAAREVYNHELDHIRDVVRFTAAAAYTADALAGATPVKIATLLDPLLKSEQLDILTAVDATGRVIYRASNPAVAGDDQAANRFVARALKGEILSGTSIFPARELALENPALAEQAVIPLVPTPRARPRSDTVERAGMLQVAAAPVRDRFGNLVGVLYGGTLLNNNNRLVDRVRNLVYEGVKYQGQNVGSSTIFLGDLRIATNVPTSDGGRAIGTRMSTEVYNRLILNREKWLGRAFVVSDWYFTAYEPILSLDNVPIGALYVGMKEQHFTATKLSMGVLYSFVLLVGTLFGLGVSWLAGSRMARPVKELEKAVRLVSAGERDVQIRVASRDELGSLASEFNLMARTLKEREASIIELNQGLEEKVRVRTVELEENNRLLLQTREELVRAEKLAAVGELAAGVAHEINNPLAIIRGNAELLQMSVSQEADNREEVDTIYQQVARMERIVANLLSFARQQRTVVGRVQLAAMLHDIVSQIGHQTPLTGITVREQYSPELTEIEGDEGQLRQVVTNLILNAIQAMPGGGTLTITTAGDPVSDSCLISICDTGAGIPADNLTQVFNPFFTTKAGGTGLGLSVSYGIVREHGGSIAVTSGTGGGTTFSVTLPIRQSAAGDPA